MKNFFKKLLVFCGVIAAVSFTVNFTTSAPAEARSLGECDTTFLGLVNWDCNFDPDMEGGNEASQQKLITNVASIATNILTDVTVIAAYLVIGYVIYGGYLYMFATGDPGKAAAGKKTLTNAFIGLAIVLSAYTIFGAIRIALIGNTSLGDCDPLNGTCVDGGTMVTNLIQWVVGVAGVVSAVFVVVGGWGYITSAGDPNKLQKAKTTILYALIGLVIVALAEIITAFVSNLVRQANESSYLDTTTAIVINNQKELL